MQTPSVERERHSWVIAIPPYASSISKNIFHPGFRRIFVLRLSFGLKHSSYFQSKSLLRNIFGYHWKSVKRGHDVNKKYEWALDSKGSFDVSLLLQKRENKVATLLLHCSGYILKGFHPGHMHCLCKQLTNSSKKGTQPFILIKASSKHQMIAMLGTARH